MPKNHEARWVKGRAEKILKKCGSQDQISFNKYQIHILQFADHSIIDLTNYQLPYIKDGEDLPDTHFDQDHISDQLINIEDGVNWDGWLIG